MIFEEEDRCQISLDILTERCRLLLESRYPGEKFWFADNDKWPKASEDNDQLNVVLFGSFLKRILESGNWNFKKYRFFVLSERVSAVLTNLIKIPKESIIVIKREELFPNIKKASQIKFNESSELVYAGRLSACKNLEFLFYFRKYLSEKVGKNIPLHLFGDFDDEQHPQGIQKESTDYKAVLQNIDNDSSIKYHGKLASDEWPKKLSKDSIGVNFSTYYQEDFGVSMSQFQEYGSPLLISNWGGHGDIVDNESVLKIDAFRIGESFEPLEIIEAKAFALVEHIFKENIEKKDFFTEETNKSFEWLEKEKLDEIRRTFVDSLGEHAGDAIAGRFDLFFHSPRGKKFWNHYKNYFSDHILASSKNVLLINDLNNEIGGVTSLAPLVAFTWTSYYFQNEGCRYISFNQLKDKENLKLFLSAEHIILSFAFSESMPLIDYIKKTLGLNTALSIYYDKKNPPKDLKKIESSLSKNDQLVPLSSNNLENMIPGNNDES